MISHLTNRQQIAIAYFILALTGLTYGPGCASQDEGGDETWVFSETSDDDPATTQEDDIEEPSEGKVECPSFDDEQWSQENFAFALYQDLASRREIDENIVFSPAAIRLALAEVAEHRGGTDAHQIAARLGYPDAESMSSELDQYRSDLLGRMPSPADDLEDTPAYYSIEETDEDRLLAALGVEFFDVQCAGGNGQDCQWRAQNNRWSSDLLTVEPPSAIHGVRPPTLRALLLRGQFERPAASSYPRDNIPFFLNDGTQAEGTFYTFFESPHHWDDDSAIVQISLAGRQISLFLIGTPHTPGRELDLDIQQIEALESQLCSEQFQQWRNQIPPQGKRWLDGFHLPDFNLAQTVDAAEVLGLSDELQTTTRFSIQEQGINEVEPVELITEEGVTPLVGYDHQYFSFNSAFVFVVYDHPTDSILLMGRVADPR